MPKQSGGTDFALNAESVPPCIGLVGSLFWGHFWGSYKDDLRGDGLRPPPQMISGFPIIIIRHPKVSTKQPPKQPPQTAPRDVPWGVGVPRVVPRGIPRGSPRRTHRGTPPSDPWIFSLRSGARIMRTCTTSVNGSLPYVIERIGYLRLGLLKACPRPARG